MMNFQLSTLIFGMIAASFGCSNATADFEDVVQKVKEGSLKPNKDGVIVVPIKSAEGVVNNEIFVEKRNDGLLLVLFPTKTGRGDDLEGFLYCSRELRPSDYYTVNWGEGGVHKHIDVATRYLLTVERLTPNWYSVSRRLD